MFNNTRNSASGSFPHIGDDIQTFVQEVHSTMNRDSEVGEAELLQMIYQHIPLLIHEVASGTSIFDWEVPQKWTVKNAYLKDSQGNTLLNIHEDPHCLVGYSQPVKGFFSLDELIPHLFSQPDQPDLVSPKTFYLKDKWGFCLPYRLREQLKEDIYEVCIESAFAPGYLCYGEYYIPGERQEEILICTQFGHPRPQNSHFTTLGIATFLAKYLDQQSLRKYSYRFLFTPTHIGPITWLALNQEQLDRVRHGLVLSELGSQGSFSYQKSQRKQAEIDRAFEYLSTLDPKLGELREFSPVGSGNRNFCSPGFNLPMGSLSRYEMAPLTAIPSSSIDLDTPQNLLDSFHFVLEALEILEGNEVFENLFPFCEPQWTKKGIIDSTDGKKGVNDTYRNSLLWVWSQSNGKTDLIQIARDSKLPFSIILQAAKDMEAHGLLKSVPQVPSLEAFTRSLSF